jgi:choice-of-anchor A domain-containing protein
MTRTSLNWSVTLILAFAAACGSSDKGVGSTGQSNVGGRSPYNFGGANPSDGGVSNSGSTAAVSGKGGGSSSNAGSGSTAGAGDTSSAGAGEGSSLGGGENGGSTNPDDTSVMHGTGGTQDILDTGGTGNSHDVGSGGGSSLDVGTGGGISFDVPTGGGKSIDVMTGGGSSIDLMTGGGSSLDMPTGGGGSLDLGTGGAPSIDLGCEKTDLTNINVYVTIDATPTGADTEGNMYVGGDLISTGSYTVGAKNAKDCSHYTLVVGGDISIAGGGTINGGKAVYGGNPLSISAVAFECGISRGAPVDFDALKATVEELSRRLSKLTPNCTVTTAAGNKIVLTGKDKTLNICSIDASQLGNIDVNFPAGSSVVVNVSGTDANWGGAAVCLNGKCDDSDQANYVVWNFYEATSLYASGIAIEGSVLAPFATLEGSGGHIAGQVIVQYLNSGLEYHPYYFDGCIEWPNAI